MKKHFSHYYILLATWFSYVIIPCEGHAQSALSEIEVTALFIFIFVMMAVICIFLLFHIWRVKRRHSKDDPELKELIVSASIGGYYYWDAKSDHCEFSLNLAKMLHLRNDIATFEQACPLFGSNAEALLSEYKALKNGLKNSFLINLAVEIAGEEKHFQCSANRVIDRQGNTKGIILWFFDISEYITEFDYILHDNHRLNKDLALYVNVLNALPIPVWQRNVELDIKYHNHAYSRFVEHSSSASDKKLSMYDDAKKLAKKAWEDKSLRKEQQHLIKGGETLGFDACLDHYSDDLAEQLANACSSGIDVYFENVGGKVFDAVMPLLNTCARIPLCGLISQYNATEPKQGPDRLSQLMGMILVKRITVRGFIIFDDYASEYPTFAKDMSAWMAEGKIQYREQIVDGLENAPQAFMGLLEGKNFGKLVVRVGEDELA